MTNFLPYAIIAGIAIVFFVICYILYSSGEKSESSPQTETQNGKTKTRTRYDGGPQPRKVQHRRPATVKHARQLPNVAVEEDTEPLPQVPKMTLGERRELRPLAPAAAAFGFGLGCSASRRKAKRSATMEKSSIEKPLCPYGEAPMPTASMRRRYCRAMKSWKPWKRWTRKKR